MCLFLCDSLLSHVHTHTHMHCHTQMCWNYIVRWKNITVWSTQYVIPPHRHRQTHIGETRIALSTQPEKQYTASSPYIWIFDLKAVYVRSCLCVCVVRCGNCWGEKTSGTGWLQGENRGGPVFRNPFFPCSRSNINYWLNKIRVREAHTQTSVVLLRWRQFQSHRVTAAQVTIFPVCLQGRGRGGAAPNIPHPWPGINAGHSSGMLWMQEGATEKIQQVTGDANGH